MPDFEALARRVAYGHRSWFYGRDFGYTVEIARTGIEDAWLEGVRDTNALLSAGTRAVQLDIAREAAQHGWVLKQGRMSTYFERYANSTVIADESPQDRAAEQLDTQQAVQSVLQSLTPLERSVLEAYAAVEGPAPHGRTAVAAKAIGVSDYEFRKLLKQAKAKFTERYRPWA